MRIEEYSINDIVPYEFNPRKNEDAIPYVMESIKEFGFKVPIVIDKNNVVIAGHTRLESAKRLGLKTVPCIKADDLSDEQVKAFRLADNKVSEKAEWDFDLLDKELEDILDIDMTLFDFELPEEEEEEYEYNDNERERTVEGYNLDILDLERVDGFYQMPIIRNNHHVPKELIGFNYALSSNKFDFGIHCFVDDYQFERLWNAPHKYVDKIAEYDCFLSPDFSLYTDMPMSMKIWNVYRSRLIGQYFQDRGITVIPTISWAEKETFEFCFDGIPKGSIVAVSTIGVKRGEENYNIWREGMDEMIKRIEPTHILVYGGEVEYEYGNIEVTYYKNRVTERMKEEAKKWAEEEQA